MANNNLENNESSFIEEESGGGIQIKDILLLVLHNLHWFILFALIGGAYSYWKVNGEEKLYASSASIMIKSGVSGG